MLEYLYGKRFGSKKTWAYWLRLFLYCCTVHVVKIISFIPTHAHFLHTLKTPIHMNT